MINDHWIRSNEISGRYMMASMHDTIESMQENKVTSHEILQSRHFLGNESILS